MKIQIADNLRIVKLDDANWSFEEYRTVTNKKKESRVEWKGDNGYFSSMESATKAGITRVLNSDMKLFNSLEEYKEHVSIIMDSIIKILKDKKTQFEK